MMAHSLVELERLQANERVWSIDWHPTSKILASVGSNKTITLWHPHKQKYQKLLTLKTQHTKTIRTVKFSHKGDKLVVGSFDATCSVWVYNGESQEYETLAVLEGHENQVKCVAWSGDDKKIASCSRDKNIWIWQFDPISYDYTCESVLEGHSQDIKYIEWFPKGANKLLSCSYDNSIRIWEGEDDDYVCRQVLEGHKSIVWAAVVMGREIFSVGEDCVVIRWGIKGEGEKMEEEGEGEEEGDGKYEMKQVYEGLHSLPIYTICAVGEKYIATGSADNTICILPIHPLGQVQQKPTKAIPCCTGQHESDINSIKPNPQQPTILASCSDDETIRIWQLKPQ